MQFAQLACVIFILLGIGCAREPVVSAQQADEFGDELTNPYADSSTGDVFSTEVMGCPRPDTWFIFYYRFGREQNDCFCNISFNSASSTSGTFEAMFCTEWGDGDDEQCETLNGTYSYTKQGDNYRLCHNSDCSTYSPTSL
jgi:hypothetical protein